MTKTTVNADTVVLYRPVGKYELELIRASGFRRFPPRLPEQPIFYPVLTEDYAISIARNWNTRDERSGFAGYVTRFAVRKQYLDRYAVQNAAGKAFREYWIPAEELDDFNRQIVGLIQVIHEFLPPAGGGDRHADRSAN